MMPPSRETAARRSHLDRAEIDERCCCRARKCRPPGALMASPTVIVPVAALVMVFWLPAEMPVPSSPALMAPLLVTVLRSFTPIAIPPMLLTAAPVWTSTVSWLTPPPAWKPSLSVPLQVTVWPLTGEAGWQSAKAGAAASTDTKNANPRLARRFGRTRFADAKNATAPATRPRRHAPISHVKNMYNFAHGHNTAGDKPASPNPIPGFVRRRAAAINCRVQDFSSTGAD